MDIHRWSGMVMKQFLLFLILAFTASKLGAQDNPGVPTVQDCLGAIPVCQPVYSTLASYTGHGNVYPEIHNNGVCPLCMDGEKNDVFYIITVQTSGILRFSLTPNNPNNDYDWSLFNMTNAGCDEIYTNATSLQVSCNSWGAIGVNGPTGINTQLGNSANCNGPGNPPNFKPYNKDLNVLVGQTYVLNISNWSATNQSGYTLDFSASTAVIFDNVPPAIDSIQQTVSCSGESQLFFRFTENVKCMDVFQHPEKFNLTGPSGTYTINNVTSSDCSTGATQSPFFNLEVSPALVAGSYSLSIIGNIHDLCDNVALYATYPFQLTEINAPQASAGNDTTISNGAIISLHGAASGGSGVYSYRWEPANLLVNPDIPVPTTINMGASSLFTLTVTDNANCHGLDEVLVTVVGGALGTSAFANPSTICRGAPVELSAITSGGSGNYTYTWSSDPPGFSSNLPNPTVYPTVTTTYTVQVNDGFSTKTSAVTVTVNPKPLASAGPPASIPYGTNIILQGSASGGSGNYHYYWTSNPPGFSSTEPAPTVVNLTQTTIFYLIVTDQNTNCASDISEVTITVTGSPLNCSPIANHPILCYGTSTQLHAMVGGGSGNYTYSWTAIPAGFTSTDQNPVVTPTEPTIFTLTVFDGFNSVTGSVSVQVNPKPDIHLGPADSNVCVFETIVLDAGNPGSTYYWSNGAITPAITVSTVGIGYDYQTYKVKVINQFACIDSAEINVIFSYAACTGIDDTFGNGRIHLYPNPTSGMLVLEVERNTGLLEFSITNLLGMEVLNKKSDSKGSDPLVLHLDLSQLPTGFYLITVRNNEYSRTIKFFKR